MLLIDYLKQIPPLRLAEILKAAPVPAAVASELLEHLFSIHPPHYLYFRIASHYADVVCHLMLTPELPPENVNRRLKEALDFCLQNLHEATIVYNQPYHNVNAFANHSQWPTVFAKLLPSPTITYEVIASASKFLEHIIKLHPHAAPQLATSILAVHLFQAICTNPHSNREIIYHHLEENHVEKLLEWTRYHHYDRLWSAMLEVLNMLFSCPHLRWEEVERFYDPQDLVLNKMVVHSTLVPESLLLELTRHWSPEVVLGALANPNLSPQSISALYESIYNSPKTWLAKFRRFHALLSNPSCPPEIKFMARLDGIWEKMQRYYLSPPA